MAVTTPARPAVEHNGFVRLRNGATRVRDGIRFPVPPASDEEPRLDVAVCSCGWSCDAADVEQGLRRLRSHYARVRSLA